MANVQDNIEMTLVKTRNYNLKPYGKFVLKWKIAKGKETPNMILIDDMDIIKDDSMPLPEEQRLELVKFMKQHKTEILCDNDGYFNYYTITGMGLSRVWHKKLTMYRENEGFKELVDDGHSFGKKD